MSFGLSYFHSFLFSLKGKILFQDSQSIYSKKGIYTFTLIYTAIFQSGNFIMKGETQEMKYTVIVEEFIPYHYASKLDTFIKELENINIKHSEPATLSLKHTVLWSLKYFIPTSEFFTFDPIYIETEDNINFSIKPMGFGLSLITRSIVTISFEDIDAEEAKLSKFMDNLTKNVKFEGILRIYTKSIDKNLCEKIKKPLHKKGYFCKYSNNNLIIQDENKNIIFTIDKYWNFRSEGLSSKKGTEIEKACKSISEVLPKNYLEATATWCAYDRRRLTIIYIKDKDFSKVNDSSKLEKLLKDKPIMGSNIHIKDSNGSNDFLLFIPRQKYHKGGIQPRFLLITNSNDLNLIGICAVCFEWNLYSTRMRHYFKYEDFYNIFLEYRNDPKKIKFKEIVDFSDNINKFGDEAGIIENVTSNKFRSYSQDSLIENKLEISENNHIETITSLNFLRNFILESEPGYINSSDLTDKVTTMITKMEYFSKELHDMYINEKNLEIQNALLLIQLFIVVILPMTFLQTFMPTMPQDRKYIFLIVTASILFLLFLLANKLRDYSKIK